MFLQLNEKLDKRATFPFPDTSDEYIRIDVFRFDYFQVRTKPVQKSGHCVVRDLVILATQHSTTVSGYFRLATPREKTTNVQRPNVMKSNDEPADASN